MEMNINKNEKSTVDLHKNQQSTLQTIIALNTALNDLQTTKTKLSRAKNAELTAIEQEANIRTGIEKARAAVSNISPATDPNYEESLRKAQEDLMKRSKTLEQTITVKDKQQNEIKVLEKQLAELEPTIQTLNTILGAANRNYSPFFLEISTTLNQQALIQKDITHREAELDPNEDATTSAKKHAIIEELHQKLKAEDQMLTALETRITAGESLFTKSITSSTPSNADQITSPTVSPLETSQATITTTSKPVLNILNIITAVPGLYVEQGHKTYFKECIKKIHAYFAVWHKTKSIFHSFITVAWMSLLAPLDTIFMGIFRKIMKPSSTEPSSTGFKKWLNPLTLLKALLGFVVGLTIAIISLPFTTLGAVISIITGIAIAFISMIGILLLEAMFIMIVLLLCFMFSFLKGIFLWVKGSRNLSRNKP